MSFFVERKGASKNIAYIAILVAIICAFSIVSAFLPLSAIFIIVFIPLISTLAVEYCEKKYAWLFLISALIATFVSTIYNYMDTLFYIYPGIISGFFYGYLRKRNFPITIVVFMSALVSLGLNYLSLPLIQFVYQIDMISFSLELFALKEVPNILYIVPTFIFSLSLGEITISHLLIEMTNKKFSYEERNETKLEKYYPFVSLLFASLSIAMAFLQPSIGYLFLVMAFFFTISSDYYLLPKGNKIHYLILIILLITMVFLFAFLYKKMPKQTGILLISLFLFANDFTALPIGLQLIGKEKNHGKKEK